MKQFYPKKHPLPLSMWLAVLENLEFLDPDSIFYTFLLLLTPNTWLQGCQCLQMFGFLPFNDRAPFSSQSVWATLRSEKLMQRE